MNAISATAHVQVPELMGMMFHDVGGVGGGVDDAPSPTDSK